jgi:hypothetical protein
MKEIKILFTEYYTPTNEQILCINLKFITLKHLKCTVQNKDTNLIFTDER